MSLGKYFGAFAIAKMMQVDPLIRKYLGITPLPHTGEVLGKCVTAAELGPEGALIRNITLFAVLIYELVGPMLTKMSLMKTGDIQPMSDEVRNRRQIRLAEKQETK